MTATPSASAFRPGRAARLLITARLVRAFGQGLLTVDFTLYLHALGWSSALIGGVITAVLFSSVLFTALVGPLSDRAGRKRFLVGYEIVTAFAALACLFSGDTRVLIAAALIGGFGRGGAATSPFAPVESAWLSEVVTREQRGTLFSLRSAISFFGLAIGAALAGLPDLLHRWLPGATAFRPLFAIVLLMALAALWLLWRTPEPERPPPPPGPEEVEAQQQERKAENRRLGVLAGVNALNGLGIGLVSPLMAYWFSLAFHRGPGAIAPVMAIAFAAAGLSSLGTGWLTTRLGVMRSVIWLRLLGLAMLLALPLSPSFVIAAALYVARMACNLGTAGARLSLNIGLVGRTRRGVAASLSSVSMQVPRSIGPTVAGLFFAAGSLGTPFFMAAGFQAAYLFLYQHHFRRYDPSRPR